MTAPGYWRAAFNARPLGMPIPPNWFALAAFGLLGFFLSPGFWLLGAGLEIGYLGWLSSQPRFRQSVDAQAQQAAAGADPAEVRYLGLHQQLAAEDRQRQQQIEARAREIVVSLDQSPLLASHADSLEQLVWLHLRLLAARQAMLRVVATAHRESDQLSAQEQHIARRLGADNIEQGFNSVIIGFCLVLVLMLVYYKVFGLVANMALTVNVVMIFALLSMIGATLTLPGIAGIVLTVGMAVDANVLIFERIKEEMRLGNSPLASIRAGYEKAFSTIADANVTTLIAALVLFMFGTGPVKGFAVTLSLGIVTSMFTAIFGTRAVVHLIYGRRKRVQSLSI